MPKGKPENNVYSPFSLAILLDIISHYCKGTDLHKDLIQFLEQLNYDKATAVQLIEAYQDSSTTFLSNNALFHEQSHSYNKIDYPNFSQFAEDFAKRPALRKKVNNWVEKQTKGLIKEIIVPDTPSLIAMLLNTIYLKADWINEFESPQYPSPFTLLNGEKKDTGYLSKYSLSGEDSTYYYTAKNYNALAIPYKDGRLRFEIYLPKETDGLAALIQEFKTTDLYQLADQFKIINCYYYLFPKFEIKNTLNLTEILQSLGLKKLFQVNKIAPLKDAPSPFFIDTIIQQNFIKVNEKGTEAASVTYAAVAGGGLDPDAIQPIEFHATHPFLFMIRDTVCNSIVYTGTLTEPPAYDGSNSSFEEEKEDLIPKKSWWKRILG